MSKQQHKETIDDEWNKFISSEYEEDIEELIDGVDFDEHLNHHNHNNTKGVGVGAFAGNDEDILSANINDIFIPTATDIYISTKSKIAYLNQEIDLKKLFWGIPIISYSSPQNGVIKKQMKFNSLIPEELATIKENLKNEKYFDEQIITSINNPSGRIKFKDIRKVSVGISKKDIMSYRSKKKSAFYNCFVMIIRVKIQDTYKEFHIKVFNTGKMEIPGVQNDFIFEQVLLNIITILQPFVESPLSYLQNSHTVLVNSNFNCGFFINREVLFDLLKYKYNIQCIYDPCSYPGIQCKFYYNNDIENQTGSQISAENKELHTNIVEVSFMIFRTGSILIVGMCEDNVLFYIYDFLKKLLQAEFSKINQKVITAENTVAKIKKIKIRRKTIIVNTPASSLFASSVSV